MRKFIWSILLLFCLVITMTSCHSAAPDADQEAVLIYKPWIFGHGGVDPEPVTSGLVWCVPSTDIWYTKITPVAYDEHIEDAAADNSTLVDFDIQIILQIKKGKSPVLYENYGEAWYNNNIHKVFVSHFYNLVGNYSPFDLMSNRTVTDSIESQMMTYMTNYIDSLSSKREFPVTVNNIIVGKASPNEDMRKEMDQTAAIIQRRISSEQAILAEKARAESEKQRAIADKAYMQELNLTTGEFIQLRAWDVIKDKSGANIDVVWDGRASEMWNVRRK